MQLRNKEAVEYRYSLIISLSQSGKSQKEIASLVGCSISWVSQHLSRYTKVGAAALQIKGKPKGQASRLSTEDFEILKELLIKGALDSGFPTDNWTRERIKDLIINKFSITYSAAHISKLVKKMGFTLQKPIRKSYKQDDDEVKEWVENTLPSLKKS